MTKVIWLVLFFVLAVLNIIFEKNHNRKGIFFTKPFLMPFLLTFYLLNAPTPNYLIAIALICGFLGDTFLMFRIELSVLVGSLAFLIGHAFYILVFLNGFSFIQSIPLWFYLFLLIYLAIGVLLLKRLMPSMGSMKLPGTVYLVAIFIMSFTSLLRVWDVSVVSFIFPFVGSIFFIISDTMIAFNLFTSSAKDRGTYIMATYIIAQLLIVIGFM